ncbi:MAG: hypothetical protein ACM3WT_00610, partial [Bacillota bacterium]
AATEEYEGKKQEWTGILEGELEKAISIQNEVTTLRFREIEQAVVSVFLHSQPIGQKALTRELVLLLGQTRPDKIELEKGLRRWAELSWFLDEEAAHDTQAGPDGAAQIPKSWRLGTKPNLRQMHHDACIRVLPDAVETKLVDDIAKTKSLVAGAEGSGAKVHMLPPRPRDVEDDGNFHYAVLGPSAASQSGKPSPEARRFLDETTGPDRPRVYRNAVVLAVPAEDGLEAAKNAIREYLGWEEVQLRLRDQKIDPVHLEMLLKHIDRARKAVPDAIRQAYCVVVTVSEKNEAEAFRVTGGTDPLFTIIKNATRSRIQESAVSAEALMPGGPYDLWREDEKSRRVKDLVGAFAQFPQLPKMLDRKAILDTLVAGCIDGLFVLRVTRPDRSSRTFWRETPDSVALKDPGLEVILPQHVSLSDLPASLLVPGVLPDLWRSPEITIKDIHEYFSGGRKVKVRREGYEETVMIPACPPEVIDKAIHAAVRSGKLWLTCGPASIFAEEVPPGLLMEDAVLQSPPKAVAPFDVMPQALTDAWGSDVTTALAVSIALSKKAGKTLPWPVVRDAIDGAFRAQLLERTVESGPWPCDFAGAQAVNVRVRRAAGGVGDKGQIPPGDTDTLKAEADLRPNQIQDLADQIPAITGAAAGLEMRIRLTIQVKKPGEGSQEKVARLNELLKVVCEGLNLK